MSHRCGWLVVGKRACQESSARGQRAGQPTRRGQRRRGFCGGGAASCDGLRGRRRQVRSARASQRECACRSQLEAPTARNALACPSTKVTSFRGFSNLGERVQRRVCGRAARPASAVGRIRGAGRGDRRVPRCGGPPARHTRDRRGRGAGRDRDRVRAGPGCGIRSGRPARRGHRRDRPGRRTIRPGRRGELTRLARLRRRSTAVLMSLGYVRPRIAVPASSLRRIDGRWPHVALAALRRLPASAGAGACPLVVSPLTGVPSRRSDSNSETPSSRIVTP